MLNKIKQWFKKPEPVKNTQTKKETKKKKVEATLSPKELATQNNEPYINIVQVEVDPNDINNGSFELDWNDKFVLNLIRAGYKIRTDDTDAQVVDRWFIEVCRNIALEMHEQYMADPANRASDNVRRILVKDLGDGKSEIS